MPVGVSVNLDGAEGTVVFLSDLPKRLRAEMRVKLREAADIVARQAKANAVWSSRIPGAISTATSFAASKPAATVRVDARKAPHARPLEFGNGGGVLRHPVFGNREVWVNQPTRPFLFPAGRDKRPEAVRLMQEALRDAIHR